MPETAAPRILADDLTGALDSAAAFATPERPLDICWRPQGPLPAAGAVDAATREGSAQAAAARHRALAGWLAEGRPAFKKIDSLMRGHWAVEVAALAAACPDHRLIVAPAFPFQGRVTRDGCQWHADSLEPLGPPIAQALAEAGLAPARISVGNAGTDADLDTVVARASRADGRPVLWIGTGGLAAALARAGGFGEAHAGDKPTRTDPPGPLLALIGSHHPVTFDQIARAETADPGCHLRLGHDGQAVDAVRARLERRQAAIVTVDVTGDRAHAAQVIAERFARLLENIPRPGCLFVAGGETLRDVAAATGAEGLAVTGALEPGLPRSRLRGGRFDGLPVISKSGAFGRPDLLVRLAAAVRHDRR
ncbi:four-carbon acid sugar kinase family protein [Ancylobacter terrae]|uniref:four-carbon acid sugar kinase family protein n=1 Tax=Ancylobacter sp. sgz301288 TaxID=3342077 RepID=UPI00385CFF25